MPPGRPKKTKSLLISGDALKIEDAERAFAAANSKGRAAQSVTELFGDYVKEDGRDVVDIITFCEAEWGLSMGKNGIPPMFPVQRFILKAYYGLPLDDGTTRDIVIRDKFNEKTLYNLNEREFLTWLLEEGRINTDDLNGQRLDLALIVGRRGSKTTVVSFIVCYELYKLLTLKSPQEYFQIMPDDLIEITSVSNNEQGSKNMFDRITGNIERSSFFKPYADGEPNKLDMHFRTRRDQEKYGKDGRTTLKLRAATCSARGLRGPNNIIYVLDEAAFFHKEGAKSAASNITDTAIFEAVSPSLAMFNHPNGKPAGRGIWISSPDVRAGKLYEIYEQSMDPVQGANILMLNLPTWIMNPRVSTEFLKGKYYSSPLSYDVEYGGQFADRLKGWVEDAEVVRRAMVTGMLYKERSLQRVPHFMGIDVGLKNDGTAIVICHIEKVNEGGAEVNKIEVDFAVVRYASLEKDVGEGGATAFFTPDEVSEWILSMNSRFYIVGGSMDQHYGLSIESYLSRHGMKQVKSDQTTEAKNSEMFQNLMSQFVCDRIRLPAGEIDPKNGFPKDTELVKELLSLQATQKSKYVVSVEAPQRTGCHDDLSDALARAVWQATQYMESGGAGVARLSGVSSPLSGAYRSRVASELMKMDLKRSVGPSRNRGMGYPGMNPFGGRRF